MKKVKLSSVSFVALRGVFLSFLFLSHFSYGALLEARITWQRFGDISVGTINSKGTVYNAYPDFSCVYGTCVAKWEMIIDGKIYNCTRLNVNSPLGTLYRNHIRAMNSTMINKECEFVALIFTGNERICIRLVSHGAFGGNWGTVLKITHLSSGGECGPPDIGGEVIPPIDPPVKPTSCSINGDIYLRHGNVNEDSINENRASAIAYLSCSRTSTVKVSVGNGGVIDLNAKSGLKSTIYISGKKGVNTFGNVNVLSVLFESVLSKTGGEVVGGNFSNSAVATLDIL